MKFFTFHFNWQSLFHLVWFHCIQKLLRSRLLQRALRPFSTLQNIVTKFTKCFKGCYCPSYRIVAEFSKCFKGCYCPLRHIKNLVETITKALTRKIFNLLTFNFFFMHTTQSILYILYSTHYYVIILKHGSLYKFWASETRIPQENQIKLNLIILVTLLVIWYNSFKQQLFKGIIPSQVKFMSQVKFESIQIAFLLCCFYLICVKMTYQGIKNTLFYRKLKTFFTAICKD